MLSGTQFPLGLGSYNDNAAYESAPMQNDIDDLELVDPDPFIVTTTCLAAATVALQFIQTFKLLDKHKPDQTHLVESSYTPLCQLRDAIDSMQSHIKNIEIAVEHGSNAPDKEFHNVEFGVSLGFLNLKHSVHKEYSQKLSGLIQQFGVFSQWASHLIRQNPDVAASLGEEMLGIVSDADARLNKMIRGGATNQQILAESRFILNACHQAVENLLRQRN